MADTVAVLDRSVGTLERLEVCELQPPQDTMRARPCAGASHSRVAACLCM
jgi:hypothetical protein